MVETISDYFPQPHAVNAIDSGSEHGRGHVCANDGISRHISRICGRWAPAYTFHRFLLVELDPAVAHTSYGASLSRPIFEPNVWWADYMIF
jgi:hypothetical protein